MSRLLLVCTVALGAALSGFHPRPAAAQGSDWTEPLAPFRIADDLYYVGSKDLASYLIRTAEGAILIDTGSQENAALIVQSIEKLGFRVADIKILLNTQAHYDHTSGLAFLKAKTGARLMAMAEDADLLERGGRGDFAFGDKLVFPAVTVDRRLHDGDTVELGGVTLRASRTAGHTRGCTTWVFTANDRGKALSVVLAGSTTVNEGVRLVSRPSYPGIADDYRKTFATLRSLRADVLLAAHASAFDVDAKLKRRTADGPNPFVDPTELARYVERGERAFNERVQAEK